MFLLLAPAGALDSLSLSGLVSSHNVGLVAVCFLRALSTAPLVLAARVRVGATLPFSVSITAARVSQYTTALLFGAGAGWPSASQPPPFARPSFHFVSCAATQQCTGTRQEPKAHPWSCADGEKRYMASYFGTAAALFILFFLLPFAPGQLAPALFALVQAYAELSLHLSHTRPGASSPDKQGDLKERGQQLGHGHFLRLPFPPSVLALHTPLFFISFYSYSALQRHSDRLQHEPSGERRRTSCPGGILDEAAARRRRPSCEEQQVAAALFFPLGDDAVLLRERHQVKGEEAKEISKREGKEQGQLRAACGENWHRIGAQRCPAPL